MPFTYGGEVGSEKHIESPRGVPTAADFRVWCPKKKVQSQSFQSTFTLVSVLLARVGERRRQRFKEQRQKDRWDTVNRMPRRAELIDMLKK